jgi:hypothetical protein
MLSQTKKEPRRVNVLKGLPLYCLPFKPVSLGRPSPCRLYIFPSYEDLPAVLIASAALIKSKPAGKN